MIDTNFKIFVEENISVLNELTCMYAQYKIDLTDGFWDELGRVLSEEIPQGYNLEQTPKKYEQACKEERICGWNKRIFNDRVLFIGFADQLKPIKFLHGKWPIENPWIGVRLELNDSIDEEKKLKDELDRLRSSLSSETKDKAWVLWKFHKPLDPKILSIVNLHSLLSNEKKRREHIIAIKNELLEWTNIINNALHTSL